MFKPTFLYIKQHSITGLLYFGKTIKNPEIYKGSGVKWKRILKKFGGQVNTLWYCLFLDEESLKDFAISFSKINNIVLSRQWANLIDENGLDGATTGHEDYISKEMKAEVSKKISENLIRNWKCPEYREKLTKARANAWDSERHLKHREYLKIRWTPEAKERHSKLMSGKKGKNKSRGIPKTAEHNRKNSEALKGKKKSAEHRQALRESYNIRRVCRLDDKKEMSIVVFTKWLNKINHLQAAIPEILP